MPPARVYNRSVFKDGFAQDMVEDQAEHLALLEEWEKERLQDHEDWCLELESRGPR